MRHSVYGKHLGRDVNARTALFRNLVQSLFLEEKIITSEAKSKAIKGTIDKVINLAKTPGTRNLANRFITQKKTQEKLIKVLIPRLKSRTSGYTAVVKMGRRLGDNTRMVQMRLLLEESSKASEVSKVSEESKGQVSNPSNSSKTSNPSKVRKTRVTKEGKS